MRKPVLPVLATASGMLVFALPSAAQAEGTCVSGARPAQSVGSGQDLVLCGGQFNGSINVHPGGSL